MLKRFGLFEKTVTCFNTTNRGPGRFAKDEPSSWSVIAIVLDNIPAALNDPRRWWQGYKEASSIP
jgi:hypothetical protein